MKFDMSSECFETFGETQVSLIYVTVHLHLDIMQFPCLGICLRVLRKSLI